MTEQMSELTIDESQIMCCGLCGRPVYPWNWCDSCDKNLLNFVRRRYRFKVTVGAMSVGMLALAIINYSFAVPTLISAAMGGVVGILSARVAKRKTGLYCSRKLDDIDVVDRIECGAQLSVQSELVRRIEFYERRRN